MIVLDSSAAIDLLLGRRRHERISERIGRPGETLHAPQLIDLEVLSAIRRLERLGTVTTERAEEAVEDLADLAVERYPHRGLAERVWQLRHNVTVFDAAYVALAEALDAPIVTADAALARAPGHDVVIEVFE